MCSCLCVVVCVCDQGGGYLCFEPEEGLRGQVLPTGMCVQLLNLKCVLSLIIFCCCYCYDR